MSVLIPFRPWRFANDDPSQITSLKEPERKADDRSPFVRYARSAALWAEWVRDGVVVQDIEPSLPTIEDSGYSFQLAVVPISTLRPLVSVPPSAKEHLQRLIEGVLLFADPIIVVPNQEDGFTVVGNHELFEAARAYQEDMARPGKTRSSDHCLVAIADDTYWDTLEIQPLEYFSQKDEDTIREDLLDNGYVLSPRSDDPSKIVVVVQEQAYTKSAEPGGSWRSELADCIGVKSLDISSKISKNSANTSGKKIVLTSPKATQNIQEMRTEYPYGSISTHIAPMSGAMMWSLRDF